MPPSPTATAPIAFNDIEWRALKGLTPEELQLVAGQVDAVTYRDGQTFLDFRGPFPEGEASPADSCPPGKTPRVLFIGRGWFSVWSRLPNGLVGSPMIVGRGRVFGEAGVMSHGGYDHRLEVRVQALRNGSGWVLTDDGLAEACRLVPNLRKCLERMAILRGALVPFVDAIRRSASMHGASLNALVDLVMYAELRTFAPGASMVKGGDPAGALYLLCSGTAQCVPIGATAHQATAIQAGSGFGGMLGGRTEEHESVTAVDSCTVLVVSAELLAQQLMTSPGLRRVGQRFLGLSYAAEGSASIVVVAGDGTFPLSKLGFFAAAQLHETYGDACAFVTLLPKGATVPDEVVRDNVRCAGLPVSAETIVADVQRFRDRHGHLDFIFLDPAGLPWATIAPIGPILSKVAMVVRDTFADPPVWWRADKMSWAVQLSSDWRTFNQGDARSNPYDVGNTPYQFGAVRVRFNMKSIREAGALADLSASDRERMGRWVRSISDRRVGVALGGGGAWGYAHVPLLNLLATLKVPVDVVSGSSFGALCGAYYCSLPEDKWEAALVEGGKRAVWALRKAFFSSSSLERMINKHLTSLLGYTPALAGMERPFLPVATNVGAGAEAVISTGSVGWGARCSSSFPGIFTPTTGDGFRFVDGGIVRNVPTDPLVWHDCDLLIASNIVPNPKFQAERKPRFPGATGRWLHEFNLATRANDTFRSALILMHTASDAVSWDADVLYNSPPSRYMPGDMDEGEKIIEESRSSVGGMAQQISNAWGLLQRTGRAP